MPQRHDAKIPESCAGFTPADIGLAFIAALAQQAVEAFDERLSYFEYTDDETAVRVVLRSAPYAHTAMTVRGNVLWTLKQLPTDLFNSPSIWGMDFKVQSSGQDLYLGKLSNKNRPGGALGGGRGVGPEEKGGLDVSERKQRRASLSLARPSSNSTTTTRNPNLPDNTRSQIRFRPTGAPLPNVGIFSTILEFLLALAARDRYQAIETAYSARDTSAVWIFVIYNSEPGSTQRLQVYQLVGILREIARYGVQRRIYQEMIFNLLVDELLIATGCVVMGVREREWCSGLGSGGHGVELGVVGLNVGQNISLTA